MALPNLESETSCKDPARLLRLMTSLMEGGNERTANLLSQKAGLTLDATCATLVSYVKTNIILTKSNESPQRNNNKSGRGGNRNTPGDLLLRVLKDKNSIASSLFELIVEQVFLLPLNVEQLNSKHLWDFLSIVVVPITEYFGKVRALPNDISLICEETMAIVEFIFMTHVRHSILEGIIEDPVKGKHVQQISSSVSALLNRRCRPPVFLENGFRAVAAEYSVESVNKAQFVSLVHNILLDNFTFSPNVTMEGLLHEACVVFETNDIYEEEMVNVYEFVSIFRAFASAIVDQVPEIYLKMDEETNKISGHLLSLNTIECAERIVHIYHGNGAALGLKRFSRGDRFGNRMKHKRSSIQSNTFKASLSTNPNIRGSKSVKSVFDKPNFLKTLSRSLSEIDGVIPIKKKFQMYQKSLKENPYIVDSLQRRRFSMVMLLEKGTPGPPAHAGRSLNMIPDKSSSSGGLFIPRMSSSSIDPPLDNTISNKNNVTSFTPQSKPPKKRRTIIAISSPSPSPPSSVTPKGFEDVSSIIETLSSPVNKLSSKMSSRGSNKTPTNKKRGSKKSAGNSIYKITPMGFFLNEPTISNEAGGDEEAACLKIQSAYRNMIARCEMQMVKETMRPGEGLNSNRLSSAVELSWNDITCRFVRYLGDHFWEKENDITRVNVLIIETFLAHLIKARTHFLDSNGMQLGESKAHKANSIESLETANLTKE
mmetsp:Transcript_10336/g.13505  ORF Transcript_10336/g.13505 Transcript_10336/m.13505 type:complete len:710 (-) Transcript_10336:143-2272(-)